VAAEGAPAILGRARERQALDRLLDGARGGESAVLVILGDAGIGKTALMHYCARQASGCRVAEIAGVESEMELPFAALHQLCGPMLENLEKLPIPQEQALRVAFGLAEGTAPDRFVLGLAVLSLLAEVAMKQPLVCLVDDAQWLDEASSQVLSFVGRRLLAESVVLVLGVREVGDTRLFPDLPALALDGLADGDARALLRAAIPGHLDEQVRDRIVAETRGNPLGLLELPRGMSPVELAGGFVVPGTATVSGHIEDQYVQRVRALPESTQRLMLLAAADPTGDATLLWRAARTLGVGQDAAAAADSEQLLDVGLRVRFRHPLVRSAAYAAATAEERRAAHEALAAATDGQVDPDRRVWHLAAAATRPDEAVAAALEQSAGRAQGRGGFAAAAAFLQRAAALTPDAATRVERALAAALAHVHAGGFEAARGLLAEAEAGALDDLQRARVELLRGQVASLSNAGREAPSLLLQAANRLEPLDVGLARATYLGAWGASLFAGRLAEPGGQLQDVSLSARSAPPPAGIQQPTDLLLDGLATVITEGRAAAKPMLTDAVSSFLHDELATEVLLQWGVLAEAAAVALWDFESWAALCTRQVEIARASGALAPLSIALNGVGMIAVWAGDFEAAASLSAEDEAVKAAIGTRISPYGGTLLAAYAGQPAEAAALFAATSQDALARGEGLGVQLVSWTTAILNNGLGRYGDALAAAQQAAAEDSGPFISAWVPSELVEAAVRTGEREVAVDAMRSLSATTAGVDTDWAAGIELRSRALVSEGRTAEDSYRKAVNHLSRTPLRPELARSHLLYGEWLRRQNRRIDARQHLRAAYDMFATMGAEGFAERARRELLATGEKIRKREIDTSAELTPQEEHIARLARDGRSNPEIGAELFISARTVEWHLGKVFAKLGITSRKALHNALPTRGR
jgi:DNA-binding CsgD family transcriptional regulator